MEHLKYLQDIGSNRISQFLSFKEKLAFCYKNVVKKVNIMIGD